MKKIFHKKGTDFDLDIHLYELLLAGIVTFQFEKADGTIRKAIGTLNQDFIPKDHSKEVKLLTDLYNARELYDDVDPVNQVPWKLAWESIDKHFEPKEPKKPRKPNLEIQTYYDFESKGWRSCKKQNIVAIYV